MKGGGIGTKAQLLTVAVALLVGSAVTADPPKTPLEKEVSDLKRDIAILQKSLGDIDEANRYRLERINLRLERLERKLDAMAATAGAPGPTTTTSRMVTRSPRRGTIVLDNRLDYAVTVSIDGVPYTVRPFSTRSIRDQLSGEFTYTVGATGSRWVSAPRTSWLEPGATREVVIGD